MGDPDDAHVNYTVKELLAGIKTDQTAGFARIETSMSGKADKADVARMEARLDSHQERIGRLEERHQEATHARRMWKTVAGTAAGTATTAAIVLSGLGAVGIVHL